MKKERKGKDFILKPKYPGGSQAMKRFIAEQLTYPEEAIKAKVSGTVHLKMTIDYKGKVTEVKILSSVGYGCDEEASRIAKLLTFEVPKNRRVRAQFHKKLNIRFRLPATPPDRSKAQQITYTVSKPQAQTEPSSKKPGKSYEYTIKW